MTDRDSIDIVIESNGRRVVRKLPFIAGGRPNLVTRKQWFGSMLFLSIVCSACALFTPKNVATVLIDVGCVIEHFAEPDTVLGRECSIPPEQVQAARAQALKSVSASAKHPEMLKLIVDAGAD